MTAIRELIDFVRENKDVFRDPNIDVILGMAGGEEYRLQADYAALVKAAREYHEQTKDGIAFTWTQKQIEAERALAALLPPEQV